MTYQMRAEKCASHKSGRARKAVLPLVILVMLALPARSSAEAYTHQVLYSFSGTDGANPRQSLVMDAVGNLYGTTSGGGAYGNGTIFKLSSTGILIVLHSFAGGTDGVSPSALTLDAAGNLYGTTATGGAYGNGSVFKLDTTDKLTLLYSFTGGTDGSGPSRLTSEAGNLYGTASRGGSSGNGTIFKLDATDKVTVLHSFGGGTAGSNPETGVILDAAGNLYGATASGGAQGYGTVFKLDVGGKLTILHSFAGGTDGTNPSGLALDTAGNLYGTTAGLYGACLFQNRLFYCGTVFKVDTITGAYSVIVRFNKSDGCLPYAGLVDDAAGSWYGTAVYGGAYPYTNGSVFKLNGITVTTLYTFTGAANGANPYSGVIVDSAGNVYGTTSGGGAHGVGTVFKLIP